MRQILDGLAKERRQPRAGRLDLLLECYAYLSFEERVHATYATLLEALRYTAAHGPEMVKLVADCRTPRSQIAVRSKLEAFAEPIEIATTHPRTLDGAPTTVRIPHFANFVGTVVVERPAAYLVPAAMREPLEAQGLRLLPAPAGELEVEVATVTGFGSEGGRKILEASEVGELQVTWRRERRSAPPDALLLPTDQPLGAVGVYLCEPESDDGAVENGWLPAPKLGEDFPIWRVR